MILYGIDTYGKSTTSRICSKKPGLKGWSSWSTTSSSAKFSNVPQSSNLDIEHSAS